ncbi:hypothetical protein [Adlercreutzia faecimuris]|uniref:Phage protein D n=1 Tax=Adlercreutzia faecimuris TaxID=2897341 RepID=A0ABS9WF76_9ACTN|nr:hypothetical protein [Adlercreutzia sp. JBNU-10]MCI2241523.1 hypothetical protein [Adlercreutzia sp. JBNU-10]
MVVDVVYTDAAGVEQGMVDCDLDLAYGDDENDFEAVIPYGAQVAYGSLMYVDGTEWGGVVRGFREDTTGPAPVLTALGQTWHGILAETYVCPDGDHLAVSGDANAAIAAVIAHVGLSAVFDVEAGPSGIAVSHQFARFCDAYSGIREMLAKANAKLRITKDPGARPRLAAVEAGEHADGEMGIRIGYKMQRTRPVNHLICLGKGELSERTVLHLYADEDGNVSQGQTQYGLAERQAIYENTNAEDDELMADGMRELAEMQATSTVTLRPPAGMELEVGDAIGASSERIGLSAMARITKTVVRISGGAVEIEHDADERR